MVVIVGYVRRRMCFSERERQREREREQEEEEDDERIGRLRRPS